MADGTAGTRHAEDVVGRVTELWSGPEFLWVRDPSERFVERLWTRDGWSNVVRDGDGSSPERTDQEFAPEEAAEWSTPIRAWVSGRNVVVGVVTTAAIAAAVVWGLRRGSTGMLPIGSEDGRADQPDGAASTITLGPAGRGRSGGMTQVPFTKLLDFTPAGEATIHRPDGTVQRAQALNAAEFAVAVPDSIRRIPDAFVISAPMKN